MDPVRFLNGVGECVHGFPLSHGLMLSLFLAGLVGGAGHCVGMCGPFVMAQSGNLKKLRDAALLPYHLGRISTYVMLAVLFSSVLNMALLFLPVRQWIMAPLLSTAGIMFLVSAFPRLSVLFPWARAIKLSVPYDWISKAVVGVAGQPGALKHCTMGVLLGFMPCGLVVSAIMAASSAPDIAHSALAMAAFGLGTMPALIATAFGGHALKLKFPRAMGYVTRGMMTISALWLFALVGIILI